MGTPENPRFLGIGKVVHPLASLMSRERVATLDGIRGVAILMVLAGHTAANYQPMGENLRRWLVAYANAGAGVRLFFVLSGYLITGLLLQEQAGSGRISLTGFYWRRGLRIFPAFYTYLLVVTVLNFWWPGGITLETWTAAATFTWNYALLWVRLPPEGYWNIGHLWTLALEQQFYLVWPVVLVCAGVRRSWWVALALFGWCPLARLGSYFLFPTERGLLGMMFHTGVDSLMAGCAAAILLQSPVVRGQLSAKGPAGAWVAGAWLLLLSPLAGEILHGFPIACGFTLDALAASWLIAWVHVSPVPVVKKILGQGLLPALGIISYSLYLWQQVFLSPTGPLANGHIILPWLGAGAAALMSYYLVEKTALRLKAH